MLQNTIEYRIGSLLDVPEGHIIHGCNAQGVMGSGVALAVKTKYPGAFKEYERHCDVENEYRLANLGTLSHWVSPGTKLCVWNAITQERFGRSDIRYVSYDAVATCFGRVSTAIELAGYTLNPKLGPRSKAYMEDLIGIPKVLNFPRIGAGLGGGNWNILEAIIENTVDPSIKLICWDFSVSVKP